MSRDSSVSRRAWLKAAAAFTVPACSPAAPAIFYRRVTDSAPWPARYGLATAVFQDRLWLMGGTTTLHDGNQLNDVWSTADGDHWRREVASAPWQPRWGSALFVSNDKLWLIGGLSSVEPIRNLNDIWSSPDGRRWTRELADAPWPARHVWAASSHANRMYLLGGASDGSHYYQDVLWSEDGIRWKYEAVEGPWFEKRKNLTAASYRGRIFLGGGSIIHPAPRFLNDVWASADGSKWTCVTPAAAWSPRNVHVFLVYRDKLWLVGGEVGSAHYTCDLWSTTDGETWMREADGLEWLGRHSAGTLVFRDKVWVFGGTSTSRGTSARGDIWTFWPQAM
jgi:hypothetical protein